MLRASEALRSTHPKLSADALALVAVVIDCVRDLLFRLRINADRMGVNTRLMDPAVVAGVRITRVDGAAHTWAELTD